MLSRFWNTDRTLSRKVARVVVLKPPAVEPGEPPTSIRRIRSIWELPAKRVRSTVLKPAVRGVTDWKREASRRSEKVRVSQRGWENSNR